MNIPNLLTLLRVLLIPIFILLFYLPTSWSYLTASAVFALAAATDWLDGYLARRLGQSTPFGAFLDPVADKLMVAVALVSAGGRARQPVADPAGGDHHRPRDRGFRLA